MTRFEARYRPAAWLVFHALCQHVELQAVVVGYATDETEEDP